MNIVYRVSDEPAIDGPNPSRRRFAIACLAATVLLAGCATFQEAPGLDASNSAMIRVVRQPAPDDQRQPWLMDFRLSVDGNSLGEITTGFDQSFRLAAGPHQLRLSVPEVSAGLGQIGYTVRSADQVIEVLPGETQYWVFTYDFAERRMTGLLAPEAQWRDYLSQTQGPPGTAVPTMDLLLQAPIRPGGGLPLDMSVLAIAQRF